MVFRTDRFTDTQNSIVKLSGPQIPRVYDFPIPKKAASLDFPTVQWLLTEERSKNPRYDQVWQCATDMFNKKKNSLLNQGRSQIPNECHIAIIAYTLEIPTSSGSLEIFRDFNKKCRELSGEQSWSSFPYKSLYCLLLKSTSGVQSRPDVNAVKFAYRGVDFHYSEDTFPDDNILVAFNHFASFSASPKVAEQFKNGKKGTVLTFAHLPMAALGLMNYSQFPNEEEILVFPWSTFTITDIDRRGDVHKIYLSSEGPYFDGLPYTVNQKPKINFFNWF